MLIFQNELTSLEFARLMGAVHDKFVPKVLSAPNQPYYPNKVGYHIIQFLGDSQMVKMVIAKGTLHA